MLCSSLFPQKHDGRLEVTGIPPAAKTGGTGQTLKCCLKHSSTSAADRRDIDIESTHSQNRFLESLSVLQEHADREPQFSQRPVELMCIGSNKKGAAKDVFGNKNVKQSPQMRLYM